MLHSYLRGHMEYVIIPVENIILEVAVGDLLI